MTTRRPWRRGADVFAALAVATGAAAQPSPLPNPDFTRGESIPEGATHDWNLGPTGARGWMHSAEMETSAARQVRITRVEAGSPADGVLREGDVLLGVAGRAFADDPRVELGRAIGAAEADDGRLRLRRWRDGRTEEVIVELAILGAYAATAPFDCPKSRRILDLGGAALARRLAAEPDRGNPIERAYGALALLASGREEYLPIVRTQVERAARYADPDRRELHSWWYGPTNLLLAEYVLATGDRAFMPDLERITMEIVHGQSPVGSWGHRFIQANGRLAGYGMMNAPGLPLALSLVIAREAGVRQPGLDEAIERSAGLVRFYVGKGSVPYGDHHPWIETHDDNGKNGAAAVLFNLLGDAEAATWFSHMSVASHGAERDTGHTGNYFNMLWAMPGVALSGPHASGAWMQEFGWAYDLARRWDGTFAHQGPPQPRPDSYGGWDATGAFLLTYAQPLETTCLTGSRRGAVPSVRRDEAERLVADGRGWSPRQNLAGYADRSRAEILNGLRNWSPVVRERSAIELARRDGDPTPRLIAMLDEADLHARLGACQALIQLEERAAPTVPALRRALRAEDLWLRIKAAEALARIGEAAMDALPELLEMVARGPGPGDSRGMQQRYLCFALFDPRDGMIRRSLEGVDRDLLRSAITAGLGNEDGRARGSVGSVYRRLSAAEIEPLLPAIHAAVVEPAPSGIMFADGIRLAGLEILALHRVAEGLPLCIDLVDPPRWGLGDRIRPCLAALRRYGGAARSEIPRLRRLEAELAEAGWTPEAIDELEISDLIRAIESDDAAPALRALKAPRPNR